MAEDLETVIEWQRWTDETCSGCGHPMAESMDTDLEGAYETTVVSCHACAARETAMKDLDDARGAKVVAALMPEAVEFLKERRADG